MKLLDSVQVKSDKNKKEDESVKRLGKLNKAESELIKRISDLRSEEESLKKQRSISAFCNLGFDAP